MTDESLPADPCEHSQRIETSATETPEQFEENPELQNSMVYWYPRLRDAVADYDGIETPDTLFVDIERLNPYKIAAEADEPISDAEMEEISQCPARWDDATVKRAADELGYPAFIRTDTDSAKRNMDAGSKIRSGDDAAVHDTVDALIRSQSDSGGMMPRFNCLAVREWIDIDADFEAFGGTPIGPEVRVFVRDGDVQCHHFYWPFTDESDASHHDVDDIDTEQELEETLTALEQTVDDAMDDTLRDAAAHIADYFDGYWSVDFALTTDGTWYVIDAARGDDSWHPDACEHVTVDDDPLDDSIDDLLSEPDS